MATQEMDLIVAAGAGKRGEGVKIIGRWHDTAGLTGGVLVESNDLIAVQRYMGQ